MEEPLIRNETIKAKTSVEIPTATKIVRLSLLIDCPLKPKLSNHRR
jgi:hypothetical protein